MYVALNGAVPLHQPASELHFSLSELATRIKRELTYYILRVVAHTSKNLLHHKKNIIAVYNSGFRKI